MAARHGGALWAQWQMRMGCPGCGPRRARSPRGCKGTVRTARTAPRMRPKSASPPRVLCGCACRTPAVSHPDCLSPRHAFLCSPFVSSPPLSPGPRFGHVTSCDIIRDYKTGDSLNYGFIGFDT